MAVDDTKCFYCFEHRMGCMIIAYLNLILFVCVIISVNQRDPTMSMGVDLPVEIIIKILVIAIFLAFTVILLIGLHKYKPGHVKAYMVMHLFVILLVISIFLLNLLLLGITLYKFVTNVVFIIFNLDFWRVISDYYIQMTKPFEPEKPVVPKPKETSALLERTLTQSTT